MLVNKIQNEMLPLVSNVDEFDEYEWKMSETDVQPTYDFTHWC